MASMAFENSSVFADIPASAVAPNPYLIMNNSCMVWDFGGTKNRLIRKCLPRV